MLWVNTKKVYLLVLNHNGFNISINYFNDENNCLVNTLFEIKIDVYILFIHLQFKIMTSLTTYEGSKWANIFPINILRSW